MLKLIKMDLQNCLNGNRFKVSFFLFFILSMGNIILSLKNCEDVFRSNIPRVEYMGILFGIFGGGRQIYFIYLLILPLISIFIFSDSFYLEKQNGVFNAIYIRAGRTKYIISKIIVCGIVAFLTVFITLGLNEIISYVIFNNVGIAGTNGTPVFRGYTNYIDVFSVSMDNSPILAKMILISINSIYAALLAILTFSIFLVIRVKNYLIFIGVYICEYISVFLADNFLNQSSIRLIQQGFGYSFTSGVFNFILITLIILTITIILTRIGIKKDKL
ncbi:MAG: hypothetical protein ACRC7N_20450 [Clostridium sp.]